MADKVASLYGELSLKDTMTPALKKAEGSLSSFGGSLKAAGQKVANFAGDLFKISAPVVAGFGIAINAAMGFDEAMTNTAAVMGLTRDQTAALGDQLLQIGMDSQAGPQAVANAYYDIAGGVADASTHMAIMEAAIATAEAGNADLGETTRALISVMNSYEFAAYDATYASDVMTRTVGMGVGTMNDLAGAMPQVAGLANSLGIEFEDLGAMMAYLSTKGNTFSESATQISAMMTAMIKPNEKMTAALEDLGFATGQAAIDALGLQGAYQAMVDAGHGDNMAAITGSVEALRGVTALTTPVMDELANSMSPMGPITRDAATEIGRMRDTLNAIPNIGLMATGFGQLGVAMNTMPEATGKTATNWLGLSNAMWDMPDVGSIASNFDLMSASMTDMAKGGFGEFAGTFNNDLKGITASTREIQLESLSAQMRDLTTDMEGMAITTGLQLAPSLVKVWDGLKPVVAGITDWISKNPEAVTGIAQVALIAAGLSMVLSPIGTVLGLVNQGFGLLKMGMGAIITVSAPVIAALTGIQLSAATLAGPFTLAAMAVGSLIAAVMQLEKHPTMGHGAMGIYQTAQALSAQSYQAGNYTPTGGAGRGTSTPVAPARVTTPYVPSGGATRGRAGGGGFMGGQAITVGENGREVLQFGTGGRVFNGQQMRGMGGITINNLVLNGIQDPQAMFDAIQKVARERSN